MKTKSKRKKIWQWLKGHPERWMKGGKLWGENQNPGCGCALNWLHRVYAADGIVVGQEAKLLRAIGRCPEGIVRWNDHESTTFSDVYQAFKKADL